MAVPLSFCLIMKTGREEASVNSGKIPIRY